jgi:hypothetical protein
MPASFGQCRRPNFRARPRRDPLFGSFIARGALGLVKEHIPSCREAPTAGDLAENLTLRVGEPFPEVAA